MDLREAVSTLPHWASLFVRSISTIVVPVALPFLGYALIVVAHKLLRRITTVVTRMRVLVTVVMAIVVAIATVTVHDAPER